VARGDKSSEKCRCYRTIIVENLYDDLKLDANRNMTFDNFNLNYYPEKPDKNKYGSAESPKDVMSRNYNVCEEFAQDFSNPSTKNIIISGAAGLGKTFMCGCIANALIEKCIPVIYISSIEMFNIITDSRMGRNENLKERPGIEDFIQTELLIIDDLGTENLTEARCAEFLEILNKKKEINNKRPCRILISTNLTLREIAQRYTERIWSRIYSEFIFCKFIGEDIRILDR